MIECRPLEMNPWTSLRIAPRRAFLGAIGVAAVAVGVGVVDAAEPGRTGRPLAIAVTAGRATFDVPAGGAGSKTLVIVSALATDPGPFPISLDVGAVAEAGPPTLAEDGPARPPAASQRPAIVRAVRPAGPPRASRTFHLMDRDGDPASASNYRAIDGKLRAYGDRIQVYVDADDVGRVGPDLLTDLVRTFEDRVLPDLGRDLGIARDVDGDGRFAVLISGWLGRLADGKVRVDGFVRGADLDPDLAAPFGNACDMMYLGATMEAGPHLRTVIAHEYAHAVMFSRKALDDRGRRTGVEEEGWLDEAVAHLVEDRMGFSRSNLDYRISAFLSRPERYRLVVEDYYSADLFRSHGNRGGTYLFLRWCADRYGPGLLPALVNSPRRGIANLEAATGATFADLYRRWSLALYLSGIGPGDGGEGMFRSVELRGGVDEWILAGPRAKVVQPGGAAETWEAAGTSSHFVVLENARGGAARVQVVGPPGANLQVTAVALPADLARVELVVRAVAGRGGDLVARARLAERDGSAVRLSALAWEPLVPAADPRSAPFRRGGLDMLGIASAFGTSALPPGGSLASGPIRLPGVRPDQGPIIFKAVGTDAQGRRVAAWAEVQPPPGFDDDPLGDP